MPIIGHVDMTLTLPGAPPEEAIVGHVEMLLVVPAPPEEAIIGHVNMILTIPGVVPPNGDGDEDEEPGWFEENWIPVTGGAVGLIALMAILLSKPKKR